jgi:hypothetical protein
VKASITPWKWNQPRELAAQLCADGQLDNEVIASRCNVTASSYERWKQTPEFKARVAEHVALYRSRIETTGLALKQGRIEAKKARAALLRRVIRARAKHYARYTPVDGLGHPLVYRDDTGEPILDPITLKPRPIVMIVPGGDTGLLVREEKTAGTHFSVDTGLLAELDTIERDIAIEMGDWKKRFEIEVTGTLSIIERLNAGRKRVAEEKARRDANPGA